MFTRAIPPRAMSACIGFLPRKRYWPAIPRCGRPCFLRIKTRITVRYLVQSKPLDINQTLSELEAKGEKGLLAGLRKVTEFAVINNIKTYDFFWKTANEELQIIMGRISSRLQDKLKEKGDWEIYPFAVHDLISRGRVAVKGRDVYIDGQKMPAWGYRLDENK